MKKYLFAGFLVFVVVLVATFPANLAYRWFAPAELRLNGIGGSIWSGRADEGVAGGAYLTDVQWTLKPASLLTGKLAFDASARPASGTMTTHVAVGLDGAVMLSGLSGSVPLDLVHPAFQQGGISGDLQMRFSELVITNGLPISADGTVTVSNFYAPDLSAGVLGDYQAVFRTTDSGISATVDDVSGVLDVAGEITIAADRSYSLVGEVAARPGAPPSIEQQLRFLGSPGDNGMRPFRFEGRL